MKPTETGDDQTLDKFLMPHIASGWGISKLFFSNTSWNILLRALTYAELIPKKIEINVVKIEDLSKITIDDIKALSNIGRARKQLLITDLQNVSESIFEDYNNLQNVSESIFQEYLQEETSEVKNKLNLEADLALRIIKSEDWRYEFEKEFGYSFEYVEFDNEMTTRNLNALAARANGLTLDEIGKIYEVSRERIRQILETLMTKISKNTDLKFEDLQSLLDTRLAANKNAYKIAELKTQLEIQFNARLIVDKNPGIKIQDLAKLTGINEKLLYSILQKQTKKFLYSEQNINVNKSNYSDEAILEALRLTETLMSPITRTYYDDLVEKGVIDGPGSQTVMKRFRTWNKACEAANVSYTESFRVSYESLWTKDEILDYLIEFLKNRTYGEGVQSYDQWRIETLSSAPSGAHIRNNFDTWINAKNEALSKMLRDGISPGLA